MNETQTHTEEFKVTDWPMPGDKLFVAGDGAHYVKSGRWTSFNVYADGYKEAADTLVGKVLGENSSVGMKFYPILFLYRHYLELRLKDMLENGWQLVGNGSRVPCEHDLFRLWCEVRKVLFEIWPNSPVDQLEAVEACIKELCAFDRNSMSFRYPETKDGQPTLPDFGSLDLSNLKDVMDRISTLLDSASFGLSALLSYMPRVSDYY